MRIGLWIEGVGSGGEESEICRGGKTALGRAGSGVRMERERGGHGRGREKAQRVRLFHKNLSGVDTLSQQRVDHVTHIEHYATKLK